MVYIFLISSFQKVNCKQYNKRFFGGVLMLKENRQILAKVKSYSIDVSVSWSSAAIVYRGLKNWEVLETFKRFLNDADYAKSDEALKVVKILENAIYCGGKFRETKKEGDDLIISFSFYTVENMIEFRDTMNANF